MQPAAGHARDRTGPAPVPPRSRRSRAASG